MHPRSRLRLWPVFLPGLLAIAPVAYAAETDPWDGAWHAQFSVYGWIPGASAHSRFHLADGSLFENQLGGNIYDHLAGAFMFDTTVRKGRWGIYADVDWVKFDDEKGRAASVGGQRVGADISLETRWGLKGGQVTLAGLYTLGHSSQGFVDLLLGGRYLWLKGNLSWSANAVGVGGVLSANESTHVRGQTHVTAGVVGVHGRWTPFPSKAVFMPYYFDIGKGSNVRTQQYAGGVGYAFHWGDVALMYRDLEYHDHGSGSFLRDVRLSGPSLNLTWNF